METTKLIDIISRGEDNCFRRRSQSRFIATPNSHKKSPRFPGGFALHVTAH